MVSLILVCVVLGVGATKTSPNEERQVQEERAMLREKVRAAEHHYAGGTDAGEMNRVLKQELGGINMVFNVGMPKSGSSSLQAYLSCLGFNSMHWIWNETMVGRCVHKYLSL